MVFSRVKLSTSDLCLSRQTCQVKALFFITVAFTELFSSLISLSNPSLTVQSHWPEAKWYLEDAIRLKAFHQVILG